jgi:hypothetical protein
MSWTETLRKPAPGDHIVQTWQDVEFLAEAVVEYLGAGLRAGEAAIMIARPAHTELFLEKLRGLGEPGQIVVLDAEEMLERFMAGGMPQWQRFHEVVGDPIAELRTRYPAVRAYGEMVDVLWQQGERDAAIRLEEYWNDLGRLHAFSLLCAYRMDPLDSKSYGGPLECVCKVHTHLIPARDYEKLDEAVSEAAIRVLDGPLAQILLSLAETHRSPTQMPLGQATLLWLQQNMPRTAERVLRDVRSSSAAR